MQCMMLIALLTVREYDGPTALAFAGLCILIGDPFAILSVSFQLSFGCLIGIFLFSDKIYSYLMGKLGKSKKLVGALKKWFAASVSITLGAGVITTPLVAYYFGAVSLVSVLTNLLTLWYTACAPFEPDISACRQCGGLGDQLPDPICDRYRKTPRFVSAGSGVYRKSLCRCVAGSLLFAFTRLPAVEEAVVSALLFAADRYAGVGADAVLGRTQNG